MDSNINTEIIERLVRLETKIDSFKADISKTEADILKIEGISDANKDDIIALKNKAESLGREVTEMKDKMTWISRTSIAAVVTCIGGLILAGLRVLIGI